MFLKRIGCIFLISIFISCSNDDGSVTPPVVAEPSIPEVTEAEPETETESETEPEPNTETEPEPAVLSEKELSFLSEYEYVTFNFAPDSYGADKNEKWASNIKIFLEGPIPEGYKEAVEKALAQFTAIFKDPLTFSIVATFEESNVHLIFGEKEVLKGVWQDMYEAIGTIPFEGYALYNRNDAYNMTKGRIWVENAGVPLFNHELGHVLGLGHSSSSYCSGTIQSNKSFMCSFLKEDFSGFDRAIIQTLYHPNIKAGKTFSELKPIIEELLLSDSVLVE